MTHNIRASSCYKSVTGPKTTVELLLELTLVRRVRLSCSASLERESGPFDIWRPLNFERSCVTRRSSLQETCKRFEQGIETAPMFLARGFCFQRVPRMRTGLIVKYIHFIDISFLPHVVYGEHPKSKVKNISGLGSQARSSRNTSRDVIFGSILTIWGRCFPLGVAFAKFTGGKFCLQQTQ